MHVYTAAIEPCNLQHLGASGQGWALSQVCTILIRAPVSLLPLIADATSIFDVELTVANSMGRSTRIGTIQLYLGSLRRSGIRHLRSEPVKLLGQSLICQRMKVLGNDLLRPGSRLISKYIVFEIYIDSSPIFKFNVRRAQGVTSGIFLQAIHVD